MTTYRQPEHMRSRGAQTRLERLKEDSTRWKLVQHRSTLRSSDLLGLREVGDGADSIQYSVTRSLSLDRTGMESDLLSANLTKQQQEARIEKVPQGEKKTAAMEEIATVAEDLESLPLDSKYKSPGYRMYRYRGFITSSIHLRLGIMQQLTEFRGRPSDVIVASFPKSGTTWLQEIVWRVTHHTEMADGKGSGVPLEFRFPVLEIRSNDEFLKMTSLVNMPASSRRTDTITRYQRASSPAELR